MKATPPVEPKPAASGPAPAGAEDIAHPPPPPPEDGAAAAESVIAPSAAIPADDPAPIADPHVIPEPPEAPTLAVHMATVIAPPARFRGPPAVLPGESLSDYEHLLGQLRTQLNSKDPIEELWIRDIADHAFDVLRKRRWLIGLQAERLREVLQVRLEPALPEATERDNLLREFLGGDVAAIATVDAALSRIGLDWPTINALVYIERADEFEKIERMRQLAENQRDALIRELDRRREQLHVRRNQTILLASRHAP